MNTLFGIMFEQLISFAEMSFYFCSVNSHYQPDLRKMKTIVEMERRNYKQTV